MRCPLSGVRLLTLPSTHGGLRPFAQVTSHPAPPPMGAWCGCSSLRPAPLTVHRTPGPNPVRRLDGVGWPKHTPRTSPEGAGGSCAAAGFATPERERRGPTERGGIPKGGRPPSGASLVTFCAYRKSPQRSVPGVWGWNSQATAGRRSRPEIFCEFRIKLWRKLENCAIVITGRSPGFPKLRPQTGRKELST